MTDLSEQGAVITKEGYSKAQDEVAYLKEIKRPEISDKIKAAKEMGDLSENAEYSAAKDEQAFVESRIKELEHLLKFAQVSTGPVNKEIVEVGNTVVVSSKNGEKTYTIVGYNEANPGAGLISNESPLGRAVIGQKVGEQIKYITPVGENSIKIIKIV